MAFDPTKAVLDEPKAKPAFDPMNAVQETAAGVVAGEQTAIDEEAETTRMAGERLQVGKRTQLRRERESFAKKYAEKGVPMDFDAELPATMRARASFEGDVKKRADMISRLDGVVKARATSDGNIIVRIKDEGGAEKDVLLNPKTEGVSMGDIAGQAKPLVQLALGAALAGRGKTALPLLAAQEAAVTGGSEALASGSSRVLAGQPIDAPQLAGQAAGEAALAAAMPLAGQVGKMALAKGGQLITRNAGTLERSLTTAAKDLNLSTTLAERTGSPVVARMGKLTPDEELARVDALRGAKAEGIDDIAGRKTALVSEANLASRAQPILAEVQETATKGVRTAMTDAQKAAQTEIRSLLDRGVVPTNLKTAEGGAAIRNAVIGNEDLAIKGRVGEFYEEADRLYKPVHDLAAKEGISIKPDRVVKLREDIDERATDALIEFAPGIRKIAFVDDLLRKPRVVDTGKTDARGLPVMRVSPPEPMSLDQARELRKAVFNAMQVGIAPGEGGAANPYYKKLYGALSDSIDDAVKSGSKEFQAANAVADKYYKTNIEPLQQSDIAKLFLKTDAAGRLGDEEIVTRLANNSDALNAYKTVLGDTSNEYKLLRRLIADHVMAKGEGDTLVDAGKFLARVDSLPKQVKEEVFGTSLDAIRANAKLMSRAQGANISVEELEDALAAAPGAVGKRLQEAIDRETVFNRTYNSTVRKQLVDGVLTPATAGTPETFVKRFFNSPNTSPADLRQALTQIGAKDPKFVPEFRKRLITDILDDVRIKGTAAPLGKKTTDEIEDLAAVKIKDYVTGENLEKLRVVLGDKGIDFLNNLATYAEVTAKRQAQEIGKSVAPETVAKETFSGMLGFLRNAISAGVDISAYVGRKLGGAKLARSDAVENYLRTGQLPDFLQGKDVRVLAMTAPKSAEIGSAILAEKASDEPRAVRRRTGLAGDSKSR